MVGTTCTFLKLDEYAVLLRSAQYSLMTTRVYSQSMERSGIPAYTNKLVNLLVEAPSWAEVSMRSRCCFTAPGLARNLLSTRQPMNTVFVSKIRDRHTIACEVTLEHGATSVSRRPTTQNFVALLLPIDF
jgi:hypothetical protein